MMDEALTYWTDVLWTSADSVGVKLTGEQLDTIARDIVAAAAKAPDGSP